MKVLVCCSAIVLVAVLSTGVDAADKCHLREIDLCAASAAGISKVPATEADIDKYCGIAKESKECIDTYVNQCATPIQKELYNWATKDPAKDGSSFCKRGSAERKEYLKHAPCLASAQPEAKKCVDDVHAALEKLETAKFADRIPSACCIYRRYSQCTTDVVVGKCGKAAYDTGANELKRHLGITAKSLCSGFEPNSSACRGLLPPSGTKATGNSKSIITRLFSAYATS